MEGNTCAGIAEALKLSRQAVWPHLRYLVKHRHLVEDRRNARTIYYTRGPEPLEKSSGELSTPPQPMGRPRIDKPQMSRHLVQVYFPLEQLPARDLDKFRWSNEWGNHNNQRDRHYLLKPCIIPYGDGDTAIEVRSLRVDLGPERRGLTISSYKFDYENIEERNELSEAEVFKAQMVASWFAKMFICRVGEPQVRRDPHDEYTNPPIPREILSAHRGLRRSDGTAHTDESQEGHPSLEAVGNDQLVNDWLNADNIFDNYYNWLKDHEERLHEQEERARRIAAREQRAWATQGKVIDAILDNQEAFMEREKASSNGARAALPEPDPYSFIYI